MFNGKVNHMTVIVKGVRDDDYEGCELTICSSRMKRRKTKNS